MTTPVDILRRIVASTPCTCAGWPRERCLICQASDALKVPSDLLRLADEAIDACEDAKERSTFSAWETAGEKVRAYREARREGAVKSPSTFFQGSRVVPTLKPGHDWQYDRGAVASRRSNDGKPGVVLKASDGHGLCYLVDHDQGGQAWWEPDELTSEEAGQCCAKMRESQGASIGLPSGISFCPWCGAR